MNCQNYSVASSAAGFYILRETVDADGNVSHRRETAFLLEDDAWDFLAKIQAGLVSPLQVMESHAGFYLGHAETSLGFPLSYSRDSVEYFATEALARDALCSGNWTQRDHY